ncbi:MAG TPA: N-acetylneuraminate synthase [Dehalococcoidia bacterium]|nr:N-acetylneuraminate synthase [Dehalococcoidia bacterium]|tara:strand:- start:487 stop:1395 length:909 start_codon:yes stop_codon:yes gene_type:complete
MTSEQNQINIEDLINRPSPTIIAEIGCNHKGDLDTAKEMIKIAKVFCDAQYVKFQKRNPKELLSYEQYNTPHPIEENSYGKTYGEHREFLEFSVAQHQELMEYCEEIGIGYSSSVWDMTSAKEIVSLNPDFIKIGSPSNTHTKMIEYICKEFHGDIHLSLGMTTPKEESEIIDTFQKYSRLSDLVLYHCTSGYPVPPKDICLLSISRLKSDYQEQIKGVGFSAHYTGIGLDGPAFILGADYIERHFTLDRAWKGTDHAASLEPDGLRRVRKDTLTISQALSYKTQAIMDIEKPNRIKLKYTD